MPTTLATYWSTEKSQRQTRLDNLDVSLASARADLEATRVLLIAASELEQSRIAEVATLKRQLAAIAMPADAAPLLKQLNAALQAIAKARVDRSSVDLIYQEQTAQVAELEQQRQPASASLALARAGAVAETQRAATLQTMSDRISSGDLVDLVTQVDDALSNEAIVRAKIEAEFPANAGDANKDFLTRVRDRRNLVATTVVAGKSVYLHGLEVGDGAVAKARAEYQVAWDALFQLCGAPGRVTANKATLESLAALTTPLLTAEESAALKDPSLNNAREDALDLLSQADSAERSRVLAQSAYDQAYQTARKANPDSTQATLDSGVLSGDRTALDAADSALNLARNALNGDSAVINPDTATAYSHQQLLDAWFATVPDTLWSWLEAFDGAVAELNELKNPTPAARLATLANQEDALVQRLQAADLLVRQSVAASATLADSEGNLKAVTDTASRRARAMSRSAGVF